MDLTIKSKKKLEYERLVLNNCIFRAFWFGVDVNNYLESAWYPTVYVEGTQKRRAKEALHSFKSLYAIDNESAKWALAACTRENFKKMIDELDPDERDEYFTYLGMLD